MANKVAQIFPSEIRYFEGNVQTPGQTPATTEIRYSYGTKEDPQTGQKVDPFPFDQTVIATQVRGGLEWDHTYGPRECCATPEMTQSFRPDDKPNIWFYYRTQ